MSDFFVRHSLPIGLMGFGCVSLWSGIRGMQGKSISTLTSGGARLHDGGLSPLPRNVEGKAARWQGRGQVVLGLLFLALGGAILWRMWR